MYSLLLLRTYVLIMILNNVISPIASNVDMAPLTFCLITAIILEPVVCLCRGPPPPNLPEIMLNIKGFDSPLLPPFHADFVVLEMKTLCTLPQCSNPLIVTLSTEVTPAQLARNVCGE